MIYGHTDNSLSWQVGGRGAITIKLWTTGLSVNGTTVTSDARLKYYEKLLISAIGVSNRLELVNYDQNTQFNRTYTEGTPLFHQCGFIVLFLNKLKN